MLGRRIRHARTERGPHARRARRGRSASTASQLSLVENGRREPRLSLLQSLATALGTTTTDLLDAAPPSRRAALEIELDRAQGSAAYAALGLPTVRPAQEPAHRGARGARRPAPRARPARRRRDRDPRGGAPRDDRAAPVDARAQQPPARDRGRPPRTWCGAAGYTTGALTHSAVAQMAARPRLLAPPRRRPAALDPHRHRPGQRPHLPAAGVDPRRPRPALARAAGDRAPGARPLHAAQLRRLPAPARRDHLLRGRVPHAPHGRRGAPQRGQAAQGAGRRGLPRRVRRHARGRRAAAHQPAHRAPRHPAALPAGRRRRHPVQGLRATTAVRFPTDGTGAIEGQVVCRQWAARSAFTRRNRTTEYYQYTDTPEGTFWCTTQTGSTSAGGFSITVGVPFAAAKWFRGRDTSTRRESRCPDPSLLPAGRPGLAARWARARLAQRRGARARALPAADRRVPGRRGRRGVRVPRAARGATREA